MQYFIKERIQRMDAVTAEFDATKREREMRKQGITPQPLPKQGPPPDVGAPTLTGSE